MYILIIARGYPTNKYKMNGIFEYDQAKALAKQGHKVVFAAVDSRSIRRCRHWGYESLKRDGIFLETMNIPLGRGLNRVNKPLEISLLALYKKIEKKHGIPEIIHAHFLDFGYITIKVLKDKNIPIVITEHSSKINNEIIGNDLYKMGIYAYSNADKVIAVGNTLAERIKSKFNIDVLCIPNMVDEDIFQYAEYRKFGDFTIISSGALIEHKGMDKLIEAFHKAFSSNKDTKLFIYGEGPEKNKLEKMIDEFGLNEQVKLLGLCDRKEIAKKMQESDCFVLVSKGETFGVAYIEALATGLPVIATACGGPEDFVTEDNGLLIPVNDIDSLVNALKEMYRNSKNYNKKEISEATTNKFSAKRVAERLVEVYQDTINIYSVKTQL